MPKELVREALLWMCRKEEEERGIGRGVILVPAPAAGTLAGGRLVVKRAGLAEPMFGEPLLAGPRAGGGTRKVRPVLEPPSGRALFLGLLEPRPGEEWLLPLPFACGCSSCASSSGSSSIS